MPVGISTHAGPAALPREKTAARWRHWLPATSRQSREGAAETAGANGPDLLLPQPPMTWEWPVVAQRHEGMRQSGRWPARRVRKSRIHPEPEATLS